MLLSKNESLKLGLGNDIYSAFVNNAVGELTDDQRKVFKSLSSDMSKAFIEFLTKQTFTITEMKAILEVEEIKTTAPLFADVQPTVATAAGGGPIIPATGKKGAKLDKLKLNKKGGQGGALKSTGHAYIGRNSVSNETNESNTKVKLLKENVVGE
jgi:hypothetical protein